MIDKSSKKIVHEPGYVHFSEEKKTIDIYTAINALYFPQYCEFPNKGSIESYLVLSRNAKGTNANDCVFIPLNPDVLYVTPDNVSAHQVYGKKIQTALGIKQKEYREGLVCIISNEYIQKIQKHSLRQAALEIWNSNVDTLESVAQAHPESEALQSAITILNKNRNRKMVDELDQQ